MFKKLFSITNDNNSCHKIITILGVQIRCFSSKLACKQFKRQFKTFKFQLKPLIKYSKFTQCQINPGIIDVKIEKFKNFKTIGINQTQKRNPGLIVSLTSFPDRMYDIKYALFSLLNQTIKPDKVILWLAQDQFPEGDLGVPQDVLSFKEHGLTINYTKNIRSYKKLIPAFKMYPDDIIVSADDDIYYPENWLELLYNEYLKDPKNVYAHRVHKIKFLNQNKLQPYLNWDRLIDDNSLSLLNFPSTGGGILYPPNILYKDFLNEEIFLKLSPHSDEIWFWAMVILNHVKVKVVQNPINKITITNAMRESLYSNEIILAHENLNGSNLKNQQILNVLEYYPELLKILQNANKSSGKISIK